MALSGAAPCQCLTPGGHHTTSPARISCSGPSHCWVRPAPSVTTRRCPAGWVCHADRAPGWNVTYAPEYGAVASAGNSVSTRTSPVKVSGEPAVEVWSWLRVIICFFLSSTLSAAAAGAARATGESLMGAAGS